MIRFFRERIWAHLPAETTPKQRRQAAVLWGLVLFPAFGLFHWFRHRGEPDAWALMPWMVGIGVALAAALLLPGVGHHVYMGVLRFFSVIGFVLSNLVLTLVFFLMITPIGWVMRVSGRRPLDMRFRSDGPPQWHEHTRDDSPQRYYRLF